MNPELRGIGIDFLRTLEEVDILLTSAEVEIREEAKYAAYNKSALLLLASKFENFVEIAAEVYVYLVNGLNLRSSLVPESLKLHHTFSMVSKLENYKTKKSDNHTEIKELLGEIGTLWALDAQFNRLNVPCKFNYGKHGEKELVKLFSPIGIKDIFVEVDVYIPDESMGTEGTQKKVDFKGTFNSVVSMRNNILHQNASPNLTHEFIREQKLIFQNFAEALLTVLQGNLEHLLASSDPTP